MLESLSVSAHNAMPEIELAVVVVDDNADGSARSVVDNSTLDFPLGLHYRRSSSGNIAIARNTGVEAAMELADWVAMVDDDQIVVVEWLTELMRVQAEQDADAVTAPVYARFPEDSPAWLFDQPFSELWGTPEKPDGQQVEDLQTANSVISTKFLREHPDVRFSTDLGASGGEDMVFYRTALSSGLKAHYSHHAVNWELEPPSRATYSYQLRRCLWHGNTEAVTNLRSGRDGRGRLVARAAKRGLSAVGRPFGRLARREPPQFRYALAYGLQSVGMVLGALGKKLNHN